MTELEYLKVLESHCLEAARLEEQQQKAALASSTTAAGHHNDNNPSLGNVQNRRSKSNSKQRSNARDEWDQISPLDDHDYSDAQVVLKQMLKKELALPLWNGEGCKASDGFLHISLDGGSHNATAASSRTPPLSSPPPSSKRTPPLKSSKTSTTVHPNHSLSIYQALDSALNSTLKAFDSMDVQRDILSPKFLHPHCWQFNTSIQSSSSLVANHNESQDVVMMSGDGGEHIKATSSTSSSSSLQMPPILQHVFDVDVFNLGQYTSEVLSLALSQPLFLQPQSKTKEILSIEANVRLFWAIVQFAEGTNYSNDTISPSSDDPSNISYISTLFNTFPRLVQPSTDSLQFLGASSCIKVKGLAIVPKGNPVMMPQSISEWKRLLVPYGPEGGLHWVSRFVLNEAYVKYKPNEMSINECRAKLLKYLSAVDWPNFGPSALHRQVVSLKVTEHQFPRSVQPTPNATNLSKIFELSDLPIASDSLEVISCAVPELDQLKDVSEPWIEDVMAPDWLRLQHPCLRCLWDPSFNGYGNVIKPLTQAMSIKLPQWNTLSQSTVEEIRRSLADSSNLQFFLHWLEANYRSPDLSERKLSTGFYGGVEGACKLPVKYPFESQLKYFLFHSLWVPIQPLIASGGLREKATTPMKLSSIKKSIKKSTTSSTSPPNHEDCVIRTSCPLGLLYVDTDGHHQTNLYQIVKSKQSPDTEFLQRLSSTVMNVLDRRTAHDLGIIAEALPQQALNTLRLVQKFHREVVRYAELCRRGGSNVDDDKDVTMMNDPKAKKKLNGAVVESSNPALNHLMHFIDSWHTIGFAAQTGQMNGMIALLYRILHKSGPLLVDLIVNEVYRIFTEHPLLYVPYNNDKSDNNNISTDTKHGSQQFTTVDEILVQSGHWRSCDGVIWDVQPEVLDAMNSQSSSSSSAINRVNQTQWLSISSQYSELWKESFQDFFLSTLNIPRRPELNVFLRGLQELRHRLNEKFERINSDPTLEMDAFNEISTSGVSSFRILYDCIADKLSPFELITVIQSETFRRDPAIVIEQRLSNQSSSSSSYKSLYYFAPPESTFFIPSHLDIQHPAIEIIKKKLIQMDDARIPFIVGPRESDSATQKQTAFQLLCRSVGVPSIHLYLTTQVIPRPIPSSSTAIPRAQTNTKFFPLFLRSLLKTMIISLFEVFPQLARALEKRHVYHSLAGCGLQLEPDAFSCKYTFGFTSPSRNLRVNGKDGSVQQFLPSWRVPSNASTSRIVSVTTSEHSDNKPSTTVRFIRTPLMISHPVINELPEDDNDESMMEVDDDDDEDGDQLNIQRESEDQLDEGQQAMNRRNRKLQKRRQQKFSLGNLAASSRAIEAESGGASIVTLPSETIRQSIESFDLILHIDEHLLSNRDKQLENEDESILLNIGADVSIAEAAMHLIDELCDLNPSSRCWMFQRFRTCLAPFTTHTSSNSPSTDDLMTNPALDDEQLITTTLSADLIEWIERLFEGRPRQKRTVTQGEMPKALARLAEKREDEVDIDALIRRGETKCEWNDPNQLNDTNTMVESVYDKVHLTNINCSGISQMLVSWNKKDTSLPGVKIEVYKVRPIKRQRSQEKRRDRRRTILDSDDDDGDDNRQSSRKDTTSDENHDEERVLIISRTTMDPDVDTLIVDDIEHLCRYRIELWAEEDDGEALLADHQYFNCPLPKPEWTEITQQKRMGKGVKLTWKLLPVAAEIEIAIGSGGWSAGAFYTFNPRHRVLEECDSAEENNATKSISFEVPSEFECIPLHFKMRARPISGSLKMRESLTSDVSTIMSMLPYGYCFIQPPPIKIHRSDVVDIYEEGAARADKNIEVEEESGQDESNTGTTPGVIETTAAQCCFPLSSTSSEQATDNETFEMPPVERSSITPGCYVLLRRSVWDRSGAVIARVDRLRPKQGGGGSVVINRKYLPGRFTQFLQLDLGGNPFELFLYGSSGHGGHDASSTGTSVDINDIIAIVSINHTLPYKQAPLPDQLDEFYKSGIFSYEGYCQSLKKSSDAGLPSLAQFHCRYMVTRTLQKYHPGGLSRSDIDVYPLPRTLLSELDRSRIENLTSQMKCEDEQFRMSAADLFAGGGGTSEGLTMSGYNVKWACEHDHYACQTWARNHPKGLMFESCVLKLLQDIREGKDGMPCPFGVRLLAGSSPCQGFSSINVRGGALDLKNRSLIFAVQQFIEVLQPHYCMFENVVGMMSSDRNKVTDFQQFMMLLLDIGYSIRSKILNALDFGSPSERQRVILIATHYAHTPPQWPKPFTPAPQFASIRQAIYDLPRFPAAESGHNVWAFSGDAAKRPLLNDDDTKHEDEEQSSADHHGRLINPLHLYCHNTTFRNRAFAKRRLPDDHFSAFLANILQCPSTHPDVHQGRIISVREVLRAMSFPDTFIADYGCDADFYKQVGNSVPPVLSFALASMIKQCP